MATKIIKNCLRVCNKYNLKNSSLNLSNHWQLHLKITMAINFIKNFKKVVAISTYPLENFFYVGMTKILLTM